MDPAPQQSLTLDQCIDQIAQELETADLHYGHGAIDAQSEALWIASKQLDLSPTDALDHLGQVMSTEQIVQALEVTHIRISTRKPLAYILGEAWLMGVPFSLASKVLFPAPG